MFRPCLKNFAAVVLISSFITATLLAAPHKEPALTFCCAATNDLFQALARAGEPCPRYPIAAEALAAAPSNSAVLILADNYPDQTARLVASDFAFAAKKNLRLYVEYPNFVPGLEIGKPQTTAWERGVVASDDFGPSLPQLRILALHDCHFMPVKMAKPTDSARAISTPSQADAVSPSPGGEGRGEGELNLISKPLLVVARVAGFDTAIYGLPSHAAPILFEIPDRHLVIATTRLSGFVRNRFAPAQDLKTILENILERLDPQHGSYKLNWSPLVAPAFGRKDRLPQDYERTAFGAYANWLHSSRLLVSPERKDAINQALASGAETTNIPDPRNAADGSLGILEGYASGIRTDGTQLQRLPLRADCNAETAMVLALASSLYTTPHSALVASNLLDFVYFNSDMCRDERADPKHGAFGLIGWGAIAPAWRVANYGDDNANAMLSTMLASASLKNDKWKSDHWDEKLLRGLLANLRTTGKLGFRGDRIDVPALAQGWKQFHDASPVNYSPHFESYLWACYLWAYHQTGFRPFLDKPANAIAMTIKAYPAGWRWQDNVERAHMLLCLAWLVRVQDTPEHRQWLQTVAGDLLKHQSDSGAIHDWMGVTGGGHLQIPQSNEEYGTHETPLIQQNGDPTSDQLYTTGYALLGLHEAAAATSDKSYAKAEDRLAEFLCRIQVRSREFSWLDGTWFRAFDDRRWEFWASSADVGWGAWSVEAGWGQCWTAATLGLRQKHTSFWDATKNDHLKTLFPAVKAQFSSRDEDF